MISKFARLRTQKSGCRSIQRAIACVIGLLALASLSLPVQAGAIASRAALEAVLGGPGTLETFQAFDVAIGSPFVTKCDTLNAATICNRQGPGLVVPGVSFTFGSGTAQWDGLGYFGAPSRAILSTGQPLDIDFLSATDAFGIDLRAFTNFGATATMQVFGADDKTWLGTLSGINLLRNGNPVFVGWEDSGGIGKVQFTQLDQPWSPIIDNLEFGQDPAAVPEPSSLLLAGIALTLAARRRRLASS